MQSTYCRKFMLTCVLTIVAFFALAWAGTGTDDRPPEDYGVDVSWPMHYKYHANENYCQEDDKLSGGCTMMCSQQREVYVQYMKGCYQQFGSDVCNHNEADRIAQNLAQPAYQSNFTSAGYAKVRAPHIVYQILQSFWEDHKSKLNMEYWNEGNVYVNHWQSPLRILPMNDPDGIGGISVNNRKIILEQTQKLLEKWVKVPLIPTSMYGIRVYSNGSILSPHVDRLPLIISAIINVAQDVDKDWILEVIGHDGKAVNLTMTPGDMILYESHSVIHGRPYPLAGQYYANVFLHYAPIGYTEQLERKMKMEKNQITSEEKFRRSMERKDEPWSAVAMRSLPPYIAEGTKNAAQWMQQFIFLRDDKNPDYSENSAVTVAHIMAAVGDLEALRLVGYGSPDLLHREDSNGWRPIHEASRSGQTKVVKYLIEQSVDLNPRTNQGEGGTALWWAQQMLPPNHPVIELLRRHGAVAIAPGE